MEKSSLSGLPLEVLHMVIERLDGPARAALAGHAIRLIR